TSNSLLSTSHLHSFPTRRSSDLRLLPSHLSYSHSCWNLCLVRSDPWDSRPESNRRPIQLDSFTRGERPNRGYDFCRCSPGDNWRSEEHTSELQSRVDLVCRLLLE